ncbi:trypsin-like peptidase domain-containing protein [Candidatus Peregrinibacteria bacterium]|nr:trypsin-like peptidase domain-containing protein [bacterium]NCQ55821.1 trypsin-like peptidase domain-containing protein [Candidatus Parcubacteria bacterium]NCS67888.1 trypsin-like peptidase domain-containing protein [Candidatus Peregrinibacteria bacterium]
MKISVLSVSLLSLILGACTAPFLSEEVTEISPAEPPVSIPLEDDSGKTLGFGTPLRPGVFVAPDHLWQVSQSLFYNDRPIEVLARDFRHDLLFFRLENQTFTAFPIWSNNPPGVGQNLSWQAGNEIKTAPVFSAKAEFELGSVTVEELMQISTVTDPGNSGKPLYDTRSNKIFGMLIASDSFKDVSYFVRSDVILKLANEYLN